MGTIGQISDGTHTFDELYEHRHMLWLALCKFLQAKDGGAWRAKRHHDGSHIEGFFVLGHGTERGAQISYHLPVRLWDQASFATTVFRPLWEYDGHGSDEILARLGKLEA